jgi:macrolide transport system ATP-binding/permease protein
MSGIVMGVAFCVAISMVTRWSAPIAIAIVGGFLFSAAVGIFFGCAASVSSVYSASISR